MEYVVIYLIYILGLLAVIWMFQFAHLKLETLRLKHRLLRDLIEHNYETENIDLNNLLK